MEKTEQVNTNQDIIPSLLDSSRKPSSASNTIITAATAGGTGSGSGDRLKRDEWSEGAVSTLLDAYESKWVLRNRAKLKGHDWEDVARHVSSRANSTKSPKTQTQCKNKIESMKKRYRSESAATDTSSWPLFPRLDLLLRYRTHPPTTTTATTNAITNPPLVILDQQLTPTPTPSLPPPPPQLPPATALPPSGTHQNSHESNGVEPLAKEEAMGDKPFEEGSDKMSMEMDSSTPISDRVKEKLKMKKTKMEKNKKRKIGQRKEAWDIAESIRWLAEVVVRSEQARMETIKEIEKMRAESEAKRGEMDLKRTEIIANTQLQIAQLLAGNGKGIDSSLRIGRN
ncbi:Trihelix transcription factor [Thalictrum thalictroides]|uniref:Trihelix transcription factor n=1 Tax=Thalictrum thalictroides TaxID=46969 RepID=A0A7J6X594_THATH|nr:Trihelix transcription factor [Thalictrum thalictroides]